MKKRKRRPARESVIQMHSRFQPDGAPIIAIGLICKALALEYTESPDHAITPKSIDRIVEILSRLPDFPDV